MRSALPDPASAPELFEGVLTRRVIAFLIDSAIMVVMTVAVSLVGIVLGFLTFGVAWIVLPFLIVFVLLAYYAMTLGSHGRATIGMGMMDLVLTPTRGAPLDGWKILIHPLIFWITVWIAWPFSLLIALLTPRRELVHDLVTGTLMLRRSPMERHWQSRARRAGTQA